jgi:hypothetical protein
MRVEIHILHRNSIYKFRIFLPAETHPCARWSRQKFVQNHNHVVAMCWSKSHFDIHQYELALGEIMKYVCVCVC